MTNEQRLSEENSDLKVLLWESRQNVNLKGWALQIEVLKEKIADRERQIEELRQTLAERNARIVELKKNIRSEGYELIQVDGKKIGSYVSQKRYEELINNMKELKQKYDRLWLETHKTK